jgi:signal transduction histidine kinase
MTAREHPARRSRVWATAIGALLVVLLISFTLGLTGRLAVVLLVGAAVAVAVWAVFRLRAERAAHEAALTSWAASEAILAERLRIARDLHDIVSHGLGMITVRAATARHLNAHNASENTLLEAIEDVEALSKQATLELRRMLETLREVDERAPRHPTDTLTALPEIIADAQRAGLRVELHQRDLGPVSPGAQLAICAIVREGLGNSARHAGFTRVQVNLSREHDTISIIITDDGPSTGWAAAPGAGHGLIGLRERVNSLGGTLYAGPHATGFRLEATVPEGTQ